MRIATANTFDASLAQLQRRQKALGEAQEHLTSGKRVLRASDDPTAAAAAERALSALSRSDAQQRALDVSRAATQLTESTLGEAGALLQKARELLVGAGNGSYSDADRASIGQVIAGLRGDLLALANRRDSDGRYLFSGQGSDGPPLQDGPGGVGFNGTPGQATAAAGAAAPLSVDGRAVWLQAEDPAAPGQPLSVFDVMDRLASELTTPGRSQAEVTETVTRGLAEIDAGSANLSTWRTRTGETLNRLDALSDRVSQDGLDARQARSTAEDLDLVQAISDFQSRQSGYDAALKTYSIVQRMSLFDYLR